MNTHILLRLRTQLLAFGMILALMAAAFPSPAAAAVLPASTCSLLGLTRTCDLWAKTGTLSLPGGGTAAMYGYASLSAGLAGLPGPTLIANSGETLEITLHNDLGETTSLSIPGLAGKSDTAGVVASGMKTYTYSSLQPGTYIYQAGPTANGERQLAMGLYGVLIVRPAGSPLQAYGAASAFTDETIIVMSEFDTALALAPTTFDVRNYNPRYFLFNGLGYPNTLNIDTAAGNKVLLRLVNAGVKSRSLGVLGLRYTVLSIDGKPLARPYSAVAETLGAGQTADVLVTIPATAPAGQKYAVYDSSLRLLNNNARFGGMLTFLNIVGTSGTGDTTGPTASGLSLTPNPSNGLTNPVVFNASVSDAATGGANVVAAEYFLDSTGTSGTGAAMSGAFGAVTAAVSANIDPGPISSGSHSVFIHGQDSLGNWGPFTSIVLVLDKAGPSTSGLSASPNPSQGTASVALSASASDVSSGNSNVNAAEFFIDATGANGGGASMTLNQIAPSVSLSGTISAATMAGLSEGNHQIFVHSRDAYGNWATTYASVQIGVDKTGPATSGILIRPNPNNGALPYSPSIQAVRVDATFSEPGAGPVTSTVANAEFFIDTACVNGTGVLMTPTDGLYNTATETGYAYIPLSTINTLSVGAHTFRFHSRDAAGNWGPCSDGTFTIDKTPPTAVSITRPGASPTNAASVQFTVNFDEAVTGLTSSNFTVAQAGGVSGASITSIVNGSAAVTVTVNTGTGSGTLGLNLTSAAGATDLAGNTLSSTGIPMASPLYTIDKTPPTFTSVTISPTSIVQGTVSITMAVNGSADTGGSGLANAGEYWFDTTSIPAGTGTAFTGTSGISVATGALTVGSHTLHARIRDNVGNWSIDRTVTLTVTAPVVPQPSIYFSTSGNTNPPGLGGTADDSDIYFWNGSTFSRSIDLSTAPYNVTAGNNVDGFDRVDATHFYVSFTGTVTLPGPVTVDDEDIAYYNAGTWSIYFNGGTFGLGGTTGPTSFDLDAISIVGAGGPGNVYFSTDNNNIPTGAGGTGDDADVYRWNGGSSYTRVVDVSTVAYGVPGGANVDGLVFVDATHFYLSFNNDGGVTLPVLGSVQDEDVVYYNAGVWSIYFDGSNAGAGLHTSNNLDIDAFDLP